MDYLDLCVLDQEIQQLFPKERNMSTREIRDYLIQDVMKSFDASMSYSADLAWDEKIDDKHFAERKEEHRLGRDEELEEILTWYDWVVEGRPGD